MRLSTTLVFALLPIAGFAGKPGDPVLLRARHADHAVAIRARVASGEYNATTSGGNPPYQLHEHYEGESFFK